MFWNSTLQAFDVCPLFALSLFVFQVVMVGSSINERDQMLFISTDEGSSFQRQAVAFTPETVIFHPKEEDKLLAYCKDGRVRVSQLHTPMWKDEHTKSEFLLKFRLNVTDWKALFNNSSFINVAAVHLWHGCSVHSLAAVLLKRFERDVKCEQRTVWHAVNFDNIWPDYVNCFLGKPAESEQCRYGSNSPYINGLIVGEQQSENVSECKTTHRMSCDPCHELQLQSRCLACPVQHLIRGKLSVKMQTLKRAI